MITVEHLTKKYDFFTAVDDISFSIGEGHIYGFLGPNVAGAKGIAKQDLEHEVSRVMEETKIQQMQN